MFFQALRDKKKAVDKLPGKMNDIARRSVMPLADDMSRLNQQQLSAGMRADGTWLPNYSPVSVSVFGKPPGKMKLYDTGAFYKGIKPEFAKTEFTLEGKDEKTDMLQDRYGDEILGLSDANIKEIARDAVGQMQYEIRKELDK